MFFFLILFAVFLMGFLVVAAIPFTPETATTNKKTIDKLNKELGFDLVERLMQVSIGFLRSLPLALRGRQNYFGP